MKLQTRKKSEWLLLRDKQKISSEREYTIGRIRKIEVERTVELARICERNILLLPMSLKFDGTEKTYMSSRWQVGSRTVKYSHS